MPLYLIDIEDDTAAGPFENKEALAEAFDDESDNTQLIVGIDDAGTMIVYGDAAEYLEDESEAS